MAPPSIPPPPPPPPPLNIPPSRARRQLAARLALHQKNSQAAEPSSASLHHNDGDDDDLDPKDPFADGEDDFDKDMLQDDDRASWWRGVVRRNIAADERGSNDGNDDDDEEFGDFAMAEDDKERPEEGSVLLKPLAVNPAKDSSRGLSGLWPFSTKNDKDKAAGDDVGDASSPVDIGAQTATGAEAESPSKPTEVKEAKRRTSIEDPDEDEPVKV